MNRRAFITALGGAAAWPLMALAQQVSGRRPLVAIQPGSTNIGHHVGFEQGLRELGFVDGQNVELRWRSSEGDLARVPAIIADLVSLNPDVIVTGTNNGVRAAHQATTTIPIVSPILTDPISNGFIASYSHPGGNVTGVLLTLEGLAGKLVQLAVEMMPGASSLGVLVNASNPATNALQLRDAKAAAAAIPIKLIPVEVRASEDLDHALKAFEREQVAAVIVLADTVFLAARRNIAQRALALRLPTIFSVREFVVEGGLISYGINLQDSWRRAGTFAAKILKGAKPSDLPVEFPTKLELAVNEKTAKALGLEIPPQLLARADEVIE
ncbi:MAG: ABC transporter substrate-binding protein [Xanthobacteraceae bacterium]